MKKNFKKLFAILMTVAVVLSMAMPALAEEYSSGTKYTLTINRSDEFGYSEGVQYNIYKLFTLDVDSIGVPSYVADATTTDILGAITAEEIAEYTVDDLWALARTISTSGKSEIATTVTGTSVELDGGYYLAVPTNTAKTADTGDSVNKEPDRMDDEGGTVTGPIFVAVPKVTETDGKYKYENAVVKAKDSKVDTQKKITGVTDGAKNETVSSTQDSATLGYDNTITYTITNTVPLYNDDVIESNINYYVVDTYDSNLVLDSVTFDPLLGDSGTMTKRTDVVAMNGGTYTVYDVSEGSKYALVREDAAYKFTVYFNYSDIKEIGEIKIIAKFHLKEGAAPGIAMPNTSELTYTNNYYTGETSTLKDEVNSYTFKFNVYKYDTKADKEGNYNPLSGAEFGLYNAVDLASGQPVGEPIAKATSLSDGEKGLVDFGKDLNAGTYYVKELNAPAGYRVDETVYRVVIEALNDDPEFNGDCRITVYAGDSDKTGTVITKDVMVKGVDGIDKSIYKSTNENIDVLGIGNTHGTTLPGTGGIGTTIFTFGGLALIVLAGILLVVYTRKQKKA